MRFTLRITDLPDDLAFAVRVAALFYNTTPSKFVQQCVRERVELMEQDMPNYRLVVDRVNQTHP
jgi:hypothetical protein